jgi:predicted ATPase
MIEAIEFKNFKALRETLLPLAPFTLLLGPNGSGKTSVLQALRAVAAAAGRTGGMIVPQRPLTWGSLLSVTSDNKQAPVEVILRLRIEPRSLLAVCTWHPSAQAGRLQIKSAVVGQNAQEVSAIDKAEKLAQNWLLRMETYALDYSSIAAPVAVSPTPILQPNGAGLAGVLDDLKDNHPERWDALLREMREWLPEYDYILFEKPSPGQKAIVLRTKKGHHRIQAQELSQGTLLALALLTLAYLPDPPSLVGLEEIDRGLHPRLLRHLQDALYRLSYPKDAGENRPPIQVIATTHSPYLLDLYREHPEEVVLAQKEGLEVQMQRLTDIKHYNDILGESPLSEVWYSGVLGGVSVKP